MAEVKAIVCRLSSLESLGAVTNICSDKTGTLTQSKMVVVRMWLLGGGFHRITGTGFVPEGDIYRQGETAEGELHEQEEQISVGGGNVRAPSHSEPRSSWRVDCYRRSHGDCFPSHLRMLIWCMVFNAMISNRTWFS